MKDEKIKEVGTETAEPTEEKQEITIDGLIGEIAEIKSKAEQESKRADEMTDMAQRLQAEFDNYRRRTNDNARRAREDATIEVNKKDSSAYRRNRSGDADGSGRKRAKRIQNDFRSGGRYSQRIRRDGDRGGR